MAVLHEVVYAKCSERGRQGALRRLEAQRHRCVIETAHGLRLCLQVSVERPGRKPLVARFGGIPLKRQSKAVIYDRQPVPVVARRKQLVSRLLAGDEVTVADFVAYTDSWESFVRSGSPG